MGFDEIMVVGAGGGWNRRPVWLHSGAVVGCRSVTLAGCWERTRIVNYHFYDVLKKIINFFTNLKNRFFWNLLLKNNLFS